MTPASEVARSTPARWKADFSLAIVAFIWGTTFVIVKQALGEISAVYFLMLRFCAASVCLLLLFQGALRKADRAAVTRGLRGGAIAGIFLWLGYMLQTFGLKYTSAGNSGFLTGLYIVLVPLISAAWFRRWPQPRELFGLLLAAAGLLVLTGVDIHLRLNFGDLLTIGCAVAFAFHLLLLGHYSKQACFEAVALGQIACSAVLSSTVLLVEPPVARWDGRLVFALLLTSVFATALAFALQTWAQRYTTPTRTALIFALEPVFALATAVIAGGEALSMGAVSGGALILSGIVIVELGSAR